MIPNARNVLCFPAPRHTRARAASQRAALALALAGLLAIVFPPAAAASPTGASFKAAACSDCSARRQAFQRARQANLRRACEAGSVAIRDAAPCPPADAARITLPPLPEGDPADAPQRPEEQDKADPE
jgi:hypothetical protein